MLTKNLLVSKKDKVRRLRPKVHTTFFITRSFPELPPAFLFDLFVYFVFLANPLAFWFFGFLAIGTCGSKII